MARWTLSPCTSIVASRRRVSSIPSQFLFSPLCSFAYSNPSFNCLKASNEERIQEISGSDPVSTAATATASQVQTRLASYPCANRNKIASKLWEEEWFVYFICYFVAASGCGAGTGSVISMLVQVVLHWFWFMDLGLTGVSQLWKKTEI